MASQYLLDLYSIRDALTAEILEMTTDKTVAGGKPDVAGPTSVAHIAYYNSRWKALQDILDKIDTQETVEGVNAAYEVTSEMLP